MQNLLSILYSFWCSNSLVRIGNMAYLAENCEMICGFPAIITKKKLVSFSHMLKTILIYLRKIIPEKRGVYTPEKHISAQYSAFIWLRLKL